MQSLILKLCSMARGEYEDEEFWCNEKKRERDGSVGFEEPNESVLRGEIRRDWTMARGCGVVFERRRCGGSEESLVFDCG